jgi:methylated-DNA-[protein]-cysteine S-methyltransferase
MMNGIHLDTPIGPLRLVSERGALTYIYLDGDPVGDDREDAVLTKTARQLDEYFAGRRTAFDLPLAAKGSPFQRAVWDALTRIPYAATCSYADIARAIDRPAAVRAVGAANGANPLPIVVPCHRVIGSDGKLVGYGGGLPRKRWLLAHEIRFGHDPSRPAPAAADLPLFRGRARQG